MQKIEREERQLQADFDYPTMSEDELTASPVPDFTAPDAHVYI